MAEASAALESLPEHYFEIYGLAVEMADRISARRVLANSFFATVNTALIALIGDKDFPWYVALAGIVLCIVWWALLKSYRDLNTAKFQVINDLETRLPAKIFSEEWEQLKKEPTPLRISPRKWLAQYRELGAVERIVPWLFVAIYLIDILTHVPRPIEVPWPFPWRICWL